MSIKPLQTLTAYEFILKDIKTKEIIDVNNIGEGQNIITLLGEFANEMHEIRIQETAKKAIKVEKVEIEEEEGKSYIHFKVSSGQFGQKSIVRDTHNSANIKNITPSEAVCKNYNVVFYRQENIAKNICIFHRWGTGGCKTPFLHFLKDFLKERNLTIEMYAIVAPENMNEILKGEKTMLKLKQCSQKEVTSSDAAENITPKKIANNMEMELIVNLKNNNMKERITDAIMNKIIKKEDTIEEYYQLPEGFDDYETIVFVEVGRRKKQFNINELGSMLCQYDITERLEFDEDNEPLEEMLLSEFHLYYQLQIQKMEG